MQTSYLVSLQARNIREDAKIEFLPLVAHLYFSLSLLFVGGYGRHRKAYEKDGWDKLRKELTMDQDRLWERNCGRDVRLCSDHGREARFPFLDAHVVHFLTGELASEENLICDFNLPPGVGDKRILRLIAKRLGFEYASGLSKVSRIREASCYSVIIICARACPPSTN